MFGLALFGGEVALLVVGTAFDGAVLAGGDLTLLGGGVAGLASGTATGGAICATFALFGGGVAGLAGGTSSGGTIGGPVFALFGGGVASFSGGATFACTIFLCGAGAQAKLFVAGLASFAIVVFATGFEITLAVAAFIILLTGARIWFTSTASGATDGVVAVLAWRALFVDDALAAVAVDTLLLEEIAFLVGWTICIGGTATVPITCRLVGDHGFSSRLA